MYFRTITNNWILSPLRYFATLHPLSSANTWLRSNYSTVLFIGWILGAIQGAISIQNVTVSKFVFKNETYLDCRHWDNRTPRETQIYMTTSFVLTFVLPMTFLTISYGAIGRRLLRAQQHWCSFKQSAPFSLHTASRTQSSVNSINGPTSRTGKLELNSQSDGQSGSVQSGFLRCKPSRQSIKKKNGTVRTTVKMSRTRSNQSMDSVQNHRQKSVKMYASQENVPGEDNNSKVLIRFDRRNTEFVNKMRVSIKWVACTHVSSFQGW